MARIRVRPRLARILIFGLAALVVSSTLLEHPAHSRGAPAGGHSSHNVAVVPGFTPAPYGAGAGVPPLPVTLKMYSKYHFTQLAANSVTTASLRGYDTVMLYGIRWSDIPSSGQAAINAFAAKHKVVIWDADATGAQTYSDFVHPFSTQSSGPRHHTAREAVAYFLQRGDFLASSNPRSPYYLNPSQLVRDPDELNDMNAMNAGTAHWRPALLAANLKISHAAWPIAWSYGVIGNHTGMTIYSGLDADAFPANERLNNDRKELLLDLAAPFRSTSAPCAPHCRLGSSPITNPFTSCEIVKVPRHWTHGRIPLVVKTSDAADITAQLVTHSGKVLAKGVEKGGLVPLVLPTKKLPANRTSRLQARVLVGSAEACVNPFQVAKVNNARPRLLLMATSRDPILHEPDQIHLLTLRVSERSSLKIVARHLHWRTKRIPAAKVLQFRLPVSVRKVKVILRDRAGNTVTRSLSWG